MKKIEFNKMIDHTLLKQDASIEGIKKLCAEAKEYHFASVCVNPGFVSLAAKLLKGTDVAVCTVVGFPLGATLPESKAYEAKLAIKAGATEVDMVINDSMAKEHDYKYILDEVKLVKKACGKVLLKVILETCLLTDKEIVECCKACVKAGADYVKTSTGFSKEGATVHAVKLMRKTVGKKLGVKAAGGIHNAKEAEAMVKAGASRLGASCGVAIVKGE